MPTTGKSSTNLFILNSFGSGPFFTQSENFSVRDDSESDFKSQDEGDEAPDGEKTDLRKDALTAEKSLRRMVLWPSPDSGHRGFVTAENYAEHIFRMECYKNKLRVELWRSRRVRRPVWYEARK
ncbi:hypothetical protein B0H14DRAFT_2636223 [Mycena olivaceomarginata]|nr:hypothetical protein B0H14DRAFT_2636223 [Mycena olivaceomarginata]